MSVTFRVELDQEAEGRWIAEIPDLPGVLCYGTTQDDAVAHVQALALRVLAERLEHGETPPAFLNVSFCAA
jgi:predicted RNase H-like HicB family nuclease